MGRNLRTNSYKKILKEALFYIMKHNTMQIYFIIIEYMHKQEIIICNKTITI